MVTSELYYCNVSCMHVVIDCDGSRTVRKHVGLDSPMVQSMR